MCPAASGVKTETAHVWEGPAQAGDHCQCGAMFISRTVATGTWCGLTVTSWETQPAAPEDGAQGA